MSGHSKWHSIRHKKGAADAKRGKIFTRHAKLIEIAAREGGGGEIESNPQLKTAVENAKADNVPNTNIDRAIKKGTGELKGAAQTEEIMYSAFGPGESAFLIECLTDNKNRTLANVKTIIQKQGGRFAETSSVLWMFEQKGVVVATHEYTNTEELELAAIDAGAQDIEISEHTIEVTTNRDAWSAVRDALKRADCKIQMAGLRYVPTQSAKINDPSAGKQISEFMEALESDDDVSDVHTNAALDSEIAKQLE